MSVLDTIFQMMGDESDTHDISDISESDSGSPNTSPVDPESTVKNEHNKHPHKPAPQTDKKTQSPQKKKVVEDDDDIFDLSQHKKRKKKRRDVSGSSFDGVKVEMKTAEESNGNEMGKAKGNEIGEGNEELIVISDEETELMQPISDSRRRTRSQTTPNLSRTATQEDIIPDTNSNNANTSTTGVTKPNTPKSNNIKLSDTPKRQVRGKTPTKRSIMVDDSDSDDEVYKSLLESTQRSKEEYQFTDQNEQERLYLVNVVPKEFVAHNTSFPIKGTKEFKELVKIIVQHYKKDKYIPRTASADNYTLFWVEGRREIKSFLKPKSLRIFPPPQSELSVVGKKGHTVIDCLLVPSSMASTALTKYDELKTTYERFAKDFSVIEDNSSSVEEIDDASEDEADAEYTIKGTIEVDDEEDGYFKIALKGKDNKQMFVKVNSETKISKIFEYYCQKRGLDVKSSLKKVKMIFDDEPLDMNDIVGNTELESDFEIQIHI